MDHRDPTFGPEISDNTRKIIQILEENHGNYVRKYLIYNGCSLGFAIILVLIFHYFLGFQINIHDGVLKSRSPYLFFIIVHYAFASYFIGSTLSERISKKVITTMKRHELTDSDKVSVAKIINIKFKCFKEVALYLKVPSSHR